ncbi:MAG: ORF6N domain-containing protein [Coriobacteriales bacterium]|nr:ORF6N domain-containing protein [Coriobacteriales bacterium]
MRVTPSSVSGEQVLSDSDVATPYGYETKAINQAASRNKKRFPPELRFHLTNEEVEEILRSQIVTSVVGSYPLTCATIQCIQGM